MHCLRLNCQVQAHHRTYSANKRTCAIIELLTRLTYKHSGLAGAAFASSWAGARGQKVQAIPFTVPITNAVAAYEQYHRGNWFLSSAPLDVEKVKEAFLPFWAVTAQVQEVKLLCASKLQPLTELNCCSIAKVIDCVASTAIPSAARDPRTGQRSSHMETDWRFVRPGWQYIKSHAAEEPHMQLYGAYKYPLRDMQSLLPGPAVDAAVRLTPSMLQGSVPGSTRKLHPFSVRPATAVQVALRAAQSREERSIKDALLRTYGGDTVDDINAVYRLVHVAAAPVYVPAYVFKFYHLDTKLYNFVGACWPLKVTGIRVYDEGRVGMVVGATAGVGAALASTHLGWFPEVAWAWPALVGVGVGAWVGMWVARKLPSLQTWYLAMAKARTEAQRAAYESFDSWDAEYVREYQRGRQHIDWDDERMRGARQKQEQQRRAGYGQARGPMPSRDPLGYYALLNVAADASTEDIQAAFRGLALRYHPDRVQGSDEAKAKAAAKFKQINEAYSVLRNANKRREYDEGRPL